MILAVTRIHHINYPFFLAASFFVKVVTSAMPAGLKKLKGRIQVLSNHEEASWDERHLWQDQFIDKWAPVRMVLDRMDWHGNILSEKVNLGVKAKQWLSKDFLENDIFQRICARNFPQGNTRYVLSGIDPWSGPGQIKLSLAPAWISWVNRACDVMLEKICNLALSGRLAWECVLGLCLSDPQKVGSVQYIYDGIALSELGTEQDKISFTWMLRTGRIDPEQILYVLPSTDRTYGNELRTVRKDRMFLYYDKKTAGKVLGQLIADLLWNVFVVDIRRIYIRRFVLQSLRWIPLDEAVDLKAYLVTFSAISAEEPITVYWNQRKVRTIMWAYGANCYLFNTVAQPCRFRHVVFCDFLVSTLIGWHGHFKRFVEEHPQSQVKVQVLGPLMCGNEQLMQIERKIINSDFKFDLTAGSKVISVFDVAPQRWRAKQIMGEGASISLGQYQEAFLQDMLRLVDENEKIIVVYKPKRNMKDHLFHYSESMTHLWERMGAHPRIKFMDFDADPWATIAVADLCICMPFESPAFAALHYGRSAIFHDPCGIVQMHRYRDFSELLTSSYQDLSVKVQDMLEKKENFSNKSGQLFSELMGFRPGKNSTDQFVADIAALANLKY
jgi:hypothetical protein